MTARQRKFAEFYVQCGNIVQSAMAAGYSETYANARAHELLENVGVAQLIRELTEKAQDERILTARERQVMLSDIARNTGAEPADRIRAVDTLNKMTGEYITRVEAKVEASQKLADVMAQIGGEGLEE